MTQSKSTAVKVFGILHLVFGTLSLVIAPLNFSGLDTTLELLQVTGLYRSWLQFTVFLSPVLAIIMIVLGIGLLRYAEWSRRGSIYLAIFSIVFSLLDVLVSAIGFAGQLGNAGSPETAGVAFGAMIGTVIGSIIGMIYPILMLILLTRPVAKASCR